jgi:hypothetical protein
MNHLQIGLIASALTILAGHVGAAPLKLEPANPQPGNVQSGLNVKYAWNGTQRKIRDLSHAKSLLPNAEVGTPLLGLDYRDTNKGDPVLTFGESVNVVADINGYIRFDSPGIYELETWSNDGLEAFVGGQQIGFVRGIQGCEANQRTEVEVPKAGWYPLHIVYFQKLGTSCLMMKWGKQGEDFTWTPDSAFGR